MYKLFSNVMTWKVASRSLKISFVVGSILNIVNQGHSVMIGESINTLQLALNYVVPFLVATYGALCALTEK